MLLGRPYVSDQNLLRCERSFAAVWLLSLLKSLVAVVTITVPRTIYSILSYSMTLTVCFTYMALNRLLLTMNTRSLISGPLP
jgi:hypothetical protein